MRRPGGRSATSAVLAGARRPAGSGSSRRSRGAAAAGSRARAMSAPWLGGACVRAWAGSGRPHGLAVQESPSDAATVSHGHRPDVLRDGCALAGATGASCPVAARAAAARQATSRGGPARPPPRNAPVGSGPVKLAASWGPLACGQAAQPRAVDGGSARLAVISRMGATPSTESGPGPTVTSRPAACPGCQPAQPLLREGPHPPPPLTPAPGYSKHGASFAGHLVDARSVRGLPDLGPLAWKQRDAAPGAEKSAAEIVRG